MSAAQHQAQPSEEAIASEEAASFLPGLLVWGSEAAVVAQAPRRDAAVLGDGAFLISQHNAVIQGVRKARRESRCELPQPVTTGKRAHICSATLKIPPARE